MTSDEDGPAGAPDERNRARANQLRLAEEFQAFFDGSGFSMALVTEDGTIARCNGAFAAMLRYEREQLHGMSIADVTHPDDRATSLQAIAGLFRGATPNYQVEKRYVRRDGEVVNVRLSVSPQRDETGRVRFALGIMEDVTARLAAEAASREASDRFRLIVEHSSDAVMELDESSRLLYVNPAFSRLLGHDAGAHLGDSLLALVHESDRPLLAEITSRPLAGVMCRTRHADGEHRRMEFSSRPFESVGGMRRVVVIGADVTARMQAAEAREKVEQQLLQVQKLEAVGTLAGGIAHDFNNLLTIILANTAMFDQELPAEYHHLREPLAEVDMAVRRCSALIRKLLALGRHERLELGPVNLHELVRELTETIRRVIPEHIEIVVEVAPDVPELEADRGAIEQMLLNLAANARDAMPDGGRLTIAASFERTAPPAVSHAAGPRVVVRVSDSGSGMDAETLSRAAEPFFTTKEPGRGTGLGLPMVFALMKQHGGHLSLSSRPGEGTTVQLEFPFRAPSERATGGSVRSLIRGGSETVLVVEDEPFLRNVTERTLQRLGYRILLASDGEDGLRVLADHDDEIDLVLSDAVMPNMGGVEMLRRLRERGSTVRFVLATGYVHGEMHAVLAEGVRVVQKPWTFDELALTIRSALDAPKA